MKLKFALVGLAAFGAAALSTGAASAMPAASAPGISANPEIQQVRLVCNRWGRCWRTGPVYYGGWGWRRRGWRRW